jgi:hypothetical protein
MKISGQPRSSLLLWPEKLARYPWNRRLGWGWGWGQSCCGCLGEEGHLLALQDVESWPVCRPACSLLSVGSCAFRRTAFVLYWRGRIERRPTLCKVVWSVWKCMGSKCCYVALRVKFRLSLGCWSILTDFTFRIFYLLLFNKDLHNWVRYKSQYFIEFRKCIRGL